jgi:hypothetical protein
MTDLARAVKRTRVIAREGFTAKEYAQRTGKKYNTAKSYLHSQAVCGNLIRERSRRTDSNGREVLMTVYREPDKEK